MTNILMIEDDEEFASLLSSFLQRYNLKVTTFSDPYLGLSSGIEKFDLLILDLTLPGMDGLEVCKEVVKKYDIPIIISSARSDLSDKVAGLQLGADDYLPKPYDPGEMYARIISLLRRYKKINDTKEQIFYDSDVFESGSDGSLAVIINRLRKKLGDGVSIKSVRGVGYKLLV